MRSTPTFVRLRPVPGIPTVDPTALSVGASVQGRNGQGPEAFMSSNDVADICLRLQEVCTALLKSPACAERIRLGQTVIGDMRIPSDTAGPIMLIVGEAVTNAVKYAHPAGVPGKIHIDCRREKEGALLIEVTDDGVGLPEGFDPAVDGNFGFQLMRSLSEKLGANLTFKSESLGLRMTLHVPAAACAVPDGGVEAPDGPTTELTDASQESGDALNVQKLILDEMKHRIRNTLATVQAIAQETWRSATADERSVFNARLRALADSHDLLTTDNWDRASLRDIIARVLHPFIEKHSDRLQIEGPDLPLSGSQSLLLTMAVHELATNAAKYGALSNGKGRVQISWEAPEGERDSLRLLWQESGGPLVTRPDKKGFGSFLVERAFKGDHGQGSIEFRPEGVVCTLTMMR